MKKYKTLKEEVVVTITQEDLGGTNTKAVSYSKVKSKHTFDYAGEVFFVTPAIGKKKGYVATHRRTGRAVDSEKVEITVSKAVASAIVILDKNCDKFEKIHRYPSIPDENLSLDLALKNLL